MHSSYVRYLYLVLATIAILPIATFAQGVPKPGWLSQEIARGYRKASRYPFSSMALERGAEDPVRSKRLSNDITVRGGENQATTFTVWGRQISYEDGTPIDFYATVTGSKVTAITGTVFSFNDEFVGNLTFFDNGSGADEVAGDGVYSAQISLDPKYRPVLADNYLVTVQAAFDNGAIRRASTGFLYSRPYARLTGQYSDQVIDGNLVIQSQIEVFEPGRFHLSGTLYTLKDEPFGTAQTAVELEPGKHWVDLTFYGLMFHDRKVEGPYRLGSLALATVNGMPNALSDLVEDAYTTRTSSRKGFTAKPYDENDLLGAAKRLEAEVNRSQRLLPEVGR